jgi:hypothetical protein
MERRSNLILKIQALALIRCLVVWPILSYIWKHTETEQDQCDCNAMNSSAMKMAMKMARINCINWEGSGNECLEIGEWK